MLSPRVREVALFVWLGGIVACSGSSASEEVDAATSSDAHGDAIIAVDPCITASTASCRAETCHNSDARASGLVLSTDAVTRDYAALFVEKLNVGDPEVTTAGDPRGCIPGRYKLIDAANPTSSLIYLKAIPKGDPTQPPCGTKMPVVGMFSASDRSCILSWIESVVAASRRP